MHDKRFVVGLTGGIGCGKSTVADLFATHGVVIVDADKIAHALTAPGGAAIDAIRKSFGEAYINADGSLNRAVMRSRVFSEPKSREALEAILHPMIRIESDEAIRVAQSRYVISVIPLLFESGRSQERVARTLVVDCPEELQIERVMKRSGLDRETIEAIMRQQISRERRLLLADDVIDNGADPANLESRVRTLHAQYLDMSTP